MSRRSGSGSSSGPSYCSNCGEKVSPSDNFCSDCGAELGGRSEGESVTDRDILEYRISKAIEAGWDLEHDFGDSAVMVQRHFGDSATHLLIALFTLWWSMGMGNVIYAAYCYFSASERMVLRPGGVDVVRPRSGGTGGTNSRSWASAVATALVFWLGAFFVGMIALGGAFPLLFTIPFAVAAIALALGGVGVLPPVRRRLEKRRSLAANGSVRSVQERSCSNPGEPCAVCGTSIRRGVERTYEKEFCLLGVPVQTTEKGTNYYCRDCSRQDDHLPAGYEDLDADDAADAVGSEGASTLEDVLEDASEPGDVGKPDAPEDGEGDESRDREREPDTA